MLHEMQEHESLEQAMRRLKSGLIKEFDTDGDGKIDQNEFKKLIKKTTERKYQEKSASRVYGEKPNGAIFNLNREIHQQVDDDDSSLKMN